jgi:hypothetical protein
MSLPRFALSLAVVIATLIACLAPRDAAPESIPARELLTLVQKHSGANYTFDRATSDALAAVAVPRPPADASQPALESALCEAGFALSPVGPEKKKVFQVARTGT